MARTIGPVLYSSGEESEHQIKSRGERLGVGGAPLYLLAETCLERILEEIARIKPVARDRRFDSDGVLAEIPVGARQHRPGARGGHAAAVHGQGPERADAARRPRHQGRQPRRSQGARARRRHRSLLRGRTPSFASSGARREEPVRRGQRARRVRDDLGRSPAGAEPVEAVPRRASAERARIRGPVLGGGLAADPRRSAGARQQQHLWNRPPHGERHRSAAALAAARGPGEARRLEPDWRRRVRQRRRGDDGRRARVGSWRPRGDRLECPESRHCTDDGDVRRGRSRRRDPRHSSGADPRARGGPDGLPALRDAGGQHRPGRPAAAAGSCELVPVRTVGEALDALLQG